MAKGYKFGVEWIALNDETSETDPEMIAGFISTLLLADLFEKDPETVAKDILRIRLQDHALRAQHESAVSGIDEA